MVQETSKESLSDNTNFMDAWNKKKTDVMKLFGNESRPKRKKDPNAPKRWKTGYILFCEDEREKVKAKHKDMKNTDVTKKLGEMWNKLSDKDKARYKKLSDKDKVRYEKEMESYTPPETTEEETTSKRKPKKERTGPKRPLSSYMYFCKEERDRIKEDYPDMKGPDVTKELGVRWKKLSDDDKVPFEELANVDKERYRSEMSVASEAEPKKEVKKGKAKKEVKESKPKESKSKTKETKPKESKSKKEVKPKESKPKKESKSKSVKKTPGYQYFVDEQREDVEQEFPKYSTRKVTSEINKRWQDLTDDERDAYELEASQPNDSDHDASDADSDLVAELEDDEE